MTGQASSRLYKSLLVYAGWVAITILVGNWLSDGKQHSLGEGVTKAISWNIVAAAAFVLAMAALFGWRDLKFNAPRPWGSLRLMWFPALYIFGFFALSLALGPLPANTMALLFVNTLFVGLSEEAMFRGVLFQGLRSRFHLWPAMIATSVLFGSVHVLNAFSTGELGASALQALAATLSGFVFMTILIRTGSIWPAIAYHALWDFGTFLISAHVTPAAKAAPSLRTYIIPVAFVIPNFLYALYLLRNVPNAPPVAQPAPAR